MRRVRNDKVFFGEEVHDDLVTKDKMYPDLFLHYIMLFNYCSDPNYQTMTSMNSK